MKAEALRQLSDGSVQRVLGWKKGDFEANPEPAFFYTEAELDELVYNKYCATNLSGYMVEAGKKDGVTLVFLKPCDTYSFNQLTKEHRVDRAKAHIVGVGCAGNVKVYEMQDVGYLERCLSCEKLEHKVFDSLIVDEDIERPGTQGRFAGVLEVEGMNAAERFAFWQGELSKCIRCNACRNACPACNCKKCVFDSNKFDTAQKANVTQFEEQMFHIIRAYHVAGRCTDCGECARVCPQNIQLQLLNRKFIKDINELYGEFQAGEDAETPGPLTAFNADADAEPSIVHTRG